MDASPEVFELSRFLNAFNAESDRGAALAAAAMLDDRLSEILTAFLVEGASAKELLLGFNAPLGTFASRTAAAHALGLIQDNEYHEITLIRKIRNEFGHSWEGVSFESGKVASLCRQLPWLGPAEHEAQSTLRVRHSFAVAILLTDLLWRTRLAASERRAVRLWPNRTRDE